VPTLNLFDLAPDPDPPAQSHSATSMAAARDIRPSAAAMREQVYAALAAAGDAGMTDEQIQDALNMGGSTQRPRRGELQKAGRVRDSGRTRPTRSGKPAVVWVIVG
jgi:hypothetical protein